MPYEFSLGLKPPCEVPHILILATATVTGYLVPAAAGMRLLLLRRKQLHAHERIHTHTHTSEAAQVIAQQRAVTSSDSQQSHRLAPPSRPRARSAGSPGTARGLASRDQARPSGSTPAASAHDDAINRLRPGPPQALVLPCPHLLLPTACGCLCGRA